jgi:hypothetical protein
MTVGDEQQTRELCSASNGNLVAHCPRSCWVLGAFLKGSGRSNLNFEYPREPALVWTFENPKF